MTSTTRRRLVGAVVTACVIATSLTGSALAQDPPPDPDPSAPATPTPEPPPPPPPPPEPEPEPEPEPPPPEPQPEPEPEPEPEPPAPPDLGVDIEPNPDVDDEVLAKLDPDEPDAPDPDDESTAAATAPGLPPPNASELGLVAPVEQALPSSSSLADDYADRLAETGSAVVDAQQALELAEQQLEEAQKRLADAEKARDAAETVYEDAVREVASARVAEEQAERELTDRVASLDVQKEVVGALAREAYRTGGTTWTSLAVVLESTTPQEFASSLRGMEAVLRSEDVVIAGMVAELADLAEAEARLQAALEERERAEQVAAQALDLARQAEETARLVAEETENLVRLRQEALDEAKEIQEADLEKYRRFLATSQSISYSLIGWSETLAADGSVQGTGEFVRPATGPLTSPFGPRVHPIYGGVRMHNGADYGLGDGGIYAADDGIVVLAGYNRSYGNVSVLSHGRLGNSFIATLYAHQSRILALPGDVVSKGQLIGLIGSTGDSTGPHLHFEVRVDGIPVDPVPLLAGAPSAAEYLSSADAGS